MATKPMTPLALARQVLDIELAGLKAVRSQLDAQFTAAVEILAKALAERNKLVVVGIGKSGNIGQKIAATFNSTGATSVLLDPANALHGDIGLLDDGDVVLALSYSGESDELVNLLGVLKKFPVQIIGLTGSPKSALGRFSDVVLNAAVPKEACPFNLAPTASTTAMLALGDALAIALLERRGFRAEDFGALHPAGALGRRLRRVDELMHAGNDLPVVEATTPMGEAIAMMSSKGFGVTGVLGEGGRLLGVITDGDLRRAVEKRGDLRRLSAGDLATPGPKTIAADALAESALALMEEHSITSLFILDGEGRPRAIVHLHDRLRAGVV